MQSRGQVWRKTLIFICLFFTGNMLLYIHYMTSSPRIEGVAQYNYSHYQHSPATEVHQQIPTTEDLKPANVNQEAENIKKAIENFFSLNETEINSLSINWNIAKSKLWQFIMNFSDNSKNRIETVLNGTLPMNISHKFQDRASKSYIYNNEYIINEADVCQGLEIDLIIVVCTAPGKFTERIAIRETWGNYTNDPATSFRLVFLLGNSKDNETNRRIFEESEKHHDIIQKNFIDSYRNLSMKSISIIKWVSEFCNNSKFALKTDDDMYINVKNLLTTLERKREKVNTFLMGHAFQGARPVQDKRSKYYTPQKDFGENVYPLYCSGTAYAMTTTAAFSLYKASLQITPFWLEDIYITGLCARLANIPRFHDWGFSFLPRKPTGCEYRKFITGHQVSLEEMHTIYKDINNPNLKC